MSKYSLPIKRLDGSVVIEPLHSIPTSYFGSRRSVRRRSVSFNNTKVQREKIFRDLAILVLLAITIVAGSAVLIGTLWRDVAVAESQARIVEAEQAANVRLAEVESEAASDEELPQEMIVFILVGLGIAIVALTLARPNIIIGR